MVTPLDETDKATLDHYDWRSRCYADFFVTYTIYNRLTGKIYAGTARGYSSQPPHEAVRRRYKEHVRGGKTPEKGWEPAVLDQCSPSKSAILGRERMLILFYRAKGMAAPENKNLPLGPKNAPAFMNRALRMFGPVPDEGVHRPLAVDKQNAFPSVMK